MGRSSLWVVFNNRFDMFILPEKNTFRWKNAKAWIYTLAFQYNDACRQLKILQAHFAYLGVLGSISQTRYSNFWFVMATALQSSMCVQVFHVNKRSFLADTKKSYVNNKLRCKFSTTSKNAVFISTIILFSRRLSGMKPRPINVYNKIVIDIWP